MRTFNSNDTETRYWTRSCKSFNHLRSSEANSLGPKLMLVHIFFKFLCLSSGSLPKLYVYILFNPCIPYSYGVEVSIFSLDLHTIGRTPWTSNRPFARPTTQTRNKRARAHTHSHTHTHPPKWICLFQILIYCPLTTFPFNLMLNNLCSWSSVFM
jgi:hypothetical protein